MKVGVLAVGNRFAGDDAVGPLVLDAVRPDLPTGVVAAELDGESTRILEAWEGLDGVVLVDAASAGAPVGTVHRVVEVAATDPRRPRAPAGTRIAVAQPGRRRSTHGAGVADALGLARVLGRLPTEVVIIGVEGTRFSPGAGVSDEVVHAVPRAVRAVLAEVARLRGVAA